MDAGGIGGSMVRRYFSSLISQIDVEVSRPVMLLANELLAGWCHPLHRATVVSLSCGTPRVFHISQVAGLA